VTTGLLLSGGMDSLAIAYWKRPGVAYTVDYGQASAKGEFRSSAQICAELGIRQEFISVDCRQLGSGALAGRAPNPLAPVPEWWPFRNQLLLTLVGMRALDNGVQELLVGCVKSDGAHADGTADFIAAMDRVFSLQEGNIRVSAPSIALTSVQLVAAAGVPLETLAWAHSCHIAEYACGFCRGCQKHRHVMEQLGHAPY
jgi:7-cyano-7-deazaguanine synthase